MQQPVLKAQVNPVIRFREPDDKAAIDQLMVATFGAVRTHRSVWNLRMQADIDELAFIAELDGRIVGALRFWEILMAGQPQLLLGPLAVEPVWQGCGVGRALVQRGLDRARQFRKWDFVFVSGDPEYYPRFGFEAVPENKILWPGFIEAERLQLLRLKKSTSLPQGPVALLPELPISA